MKKIIAMILISAVLCSLASCEHTGIETTQQTGETTETTSVIETVYDPFEEFMPYPNGECFVQQNVTIRKIDPLLNMICSEMVFFKVLDIEPEYSGDFSVYLVQVVDAYGYDYFDTEKIYRMAWRGYTEKHLYGRPPLEIGKVYARFLNYASAETLVTRELWQAGLIYDVKEEADGKRYLYGYGVDLSTYDCKIPITDPEENNIYKVGKHDKVIAKLKELGQPIPTFDYKIEAEAFFKEKNLITD